MRGSFTIGLAAVTLVAATAGVPGMAGSPLGVSAAHADGYRDRHRRHRDGFDFGDALLGAVIAGGLIAVLSSAKDDPDDDRGEPWEPQGDWDREAGDGDWGWQDRDWRNRTAEERAAISVCAREAEDLGSRYGREARVRIINGVDRQGGEYRVRGTVEIREDDNRDAGALGDGDDFICYVRSGRITGFRFSDDAR